MHASTAYTGRTLRQLDEDNQNAYYPVKIITDVVTRFLGNPFYVIKVRLQTRDISRRATFVSEAKQLWKEGQVLALFRGGMPALARYTLYSGLQTLFKNTRNTRLARSVGHNVWIVWLGNLVPLVLSYPLNTLQTRMSLHVSNYARYADIWREIKHGRTGLVQGLFAGVGVGVVGTLVYQLVIGLAEKSVDQAIAYLEKNEYIAPVPRRGISVPSVVRICVASVVAHFAAYPFDIVCARLQSGEFATVYGCVAMTLEEEGIGGFYKGVWPELFKALPMTLLMGGTYYVVGRWFRTHSKKERRDAYVNFFTYIWEDLVGALFNRL